MRPFRFLLLFLWIALTTASLQAQQAPCDRQVSEPLSGVIMGANRSVSLPLAFTLNKKVYSAGVHVKADAGADYIFGRSWEYPFTAVITFQLQALNASNVVVPGVFNQSTYTVTLTNDKPEASFIKDFSALVGSNGTFSFTQFKATVSSVSVTSSGSTPSSVLSQISSKLRLFIGYDIRYGFDLSSATAPAALALPSQQITGTREVQFKWNNSNQEFCNYQFQLLRLHNQSPATATDEQSITATVDWSQALTIQTESPATALKLTVAEGQGYYLWRVRPVGTYYPGGIAHPLNLKENLWSAAPANGTSLLLNTGNLSSYPSAFFLTDPDDQINRIYSRTFTEGNKVSETTTYANSLLQVKQTQSYLPSKDTTLVVQHVLDMSGRPALTTMPAPVDSSMYQGFKSQFFQTEDAQLYTGKNYDVDSNYNSPRRARQSAGAYKYYSGANGAEPQVADAQGYPYQRTQYYNDGTDRVKQQSGVGKQQMIGKGTGSDAAGEGKTVRTYYGTATEEELIQLFGDEAPASENVFKTINIDQNNTATITFTNKEGKVIATSLSFQDQDNDGVFEHLSGEGTKSTLNTVSDSVTVNTRTPAGFVSSKRLAILQTTPMDISYQISCDTLSFPCANGEVDCGYHLKVQLFNLDSNTVQVLYDNDLKQVSCAAVEGKTGTYKTVAMPPVSLEPGNYIIQKNLSTGNVSVAITQAQDKIDLQTGPITGLIKGWLAGVKCPSQLDTFFTRLRRLATRLNNGTATSSPEYSFPPEFVSIYLANPSAFRLTVTPSTGVPQQAVLTTPCCSSIRVPINWVPPFNCPEIPRLVDKNGNGVLDVHPYNPYASPDSLDQPEEFFPDFEGYAQVFLQGCWDSDDFYNTYMEGWKPGQFNLMIYHMLTDQYNCTNNYPSKDTSTVKRQLDSLMNESKTIFNACGDSIGTYDQAGVSYGCGDPITVNIYGVPTQVPACPQYTCDVLFNCWSAQLSALRAKICMNIDYESEDNNVGNKSDQTNPGEFNNNFSENFKSGGLLGKWIAKKAASKRMRELQADGSGTVTPEYDRHLVQDFLECTGYRFAKILTPYDRYPLEADRGEDINYTVAGNNELADMDDSKKANGDYYYMPFSDWTPGKTTSTPTPAEVNSRKYKGFFPFIKNPVYAFKYFEYPHEGVDNYQDVEAMTCYSDPNDCYKTFDQNGNTPAVRIPCCVTIDAFGNYNTSACFKDYNYPNIDSLVLDPDPLHPTFGIIEDGSGDRYKLTVANFCQIGRYSCNYIKDMWSCGQRTGFYLALKNYQVPPAGFADIEGSSDCSSINALQNWYFNPEPSVNNFPDTLSSGEVNALVNSESFSYTVEDFPQLQLKNLEGQMVWQMSSAELEMVKMNNGCFKACEQRREAVIQQLKELLFNKCYVIGPCKSATDYVADNVIPEDDFNAMVDGVIAQCQSQCAISSYRCVPLDSCRKFKTVKTSLGNNITDANVLTFGAGGASSDAPYCSQVPGRSYYDCSGGTQESVSYCQYTRYKEAVGWFMELDLPSACTGKEYSRVFSCDPGNDTCVPRDSYEKTGDPQSLPTVTTQAVPVNVVVTE